jgi:hypothetical protein
MSLRNKVFILIAGSFCACAAAFADEPRGTLADSPPEPQVLLFRSGRALEGTVSETDTHYIVVRPVGKVEILKDDIEFVAGSFDEVYRFKLEHINDRDSEAHVRLAQWCLGVNLVERAIEELERAVELAPDSSRAKGLLENVRRAANAIEKSAQTPAKQEHPTPETLPNARTYPSFQRELSTAQVTTFSVQIQPLLVRSCGTVGCHDVKHTGSLVLQGSSLPTKRTSQINLRSVLAHIDAEEPDLSPLLIESLREHGTARRSPFGAGSNDPAYGKLAGWVRAVAGKPVPKSTPPSPSAATSVSPAVPANDSSNAPSNQPGTSNLIYSNKPIPLTPARRRAGMIPANSPIDTTAVRPSSKKNESPTETPPAAESNTEKTPPSPMQPKATSNVLDSKLPASDRPASVQPPAKPGAAGLAPPDSLTPVDPFDPEIFNRQFAPR